MNIKNDFLSLFPQKPEELGLDLLKLRFAGDKELAYRERTFSGYLSRKRLGLIAGVFLVFLLALADYLSAPQVKAFCWFIRFGIAMPILLVVFALTYVEKLQAFIPNAIRSSVVALALAQIITMSYLPTGLMSWYHLIFLVLAAYAVLIMSFDFVDAAGNSAFMFLIYVTRLALSVHISTGEKAISTLIAIAVIGFCAAYSYYLEYVKRRNYILESGLPEGLGGFKTQPKQTNSKKKSKTKALDKETMVFIDKKGIVKFAPDYLEELTGFKKDLIVGAALANAFLPNDKAKFISSVKKQHREELLLADSYTLKTKDGVGARVKLELSSHMDKTFGAGYIVIINGEDAEYSSARLIEDGAHKTTKDAKPPSKVGAEGDETIESKRIKIDMTIEKLEGEKKDLEEKRIALEEKSRTMASEAEILRIKAEELEQREIALEQKNADLEQRSKALSDSEQLKAISEDEFISAELSRNKEELLAKSADLEDAKKKLLVAVNEKGRIKSEMVQLNEEIERRKDAYALIKKEMQEKADDFEDRLQQKDSEIEKIKKKNRGLLGDIDRAMQENRALRDDRNILSQEKSVDDIKLMGRIGSFASHSLVKQFSENLEYLGRNKSEFKDSSSKYYVDMTRQRIREGLYMAGSISYRFDLYSRSLKDTSIEPRGVDLRVQLQEASAQLAEFFKGTDHMIDVICPDNIDLRMTGESFRLIIQNMILNSLLAATKIDTDALIEIRVREDKTKVVLDYEDNGRAYPSYYREILNLKAINSEVLSVNGVELYLAKAIIQRECSGDLQLSVKKGLNKISLKFIK